jgi:hypothetical protein
MRRQLLGAVIAAAATVAAPAAARGDASICDPLSAGSLMAGGQGLADGIAGRGGEVREPALDQVHDDMPASAKNRASKNFTATIPVYVHVITDGATGAVTDPQIRAQINVLNRTFSGTGFTFRLAGTTRTNSPAWFYAGSSGKDANAMKATLHQGGPDALNFYSTTAADFLGWAYLPDIVTKPGQAYLDGIVIDWESLPGVSSTYAGQYDEGKTATHETGHWLNLEHTFYGACNAKGDFVDDTPPERTPTSGCPEGKDTCPAPGLDPIHNYMDYSFDSCYSEFTPGQIQRMRDAWLLYRAP